MRTVRPPVITRSSFKLKRLGRRKLEHVNEQLNLRQRNFVTQELTLRKNRARVKDLIEETFRRRVRRARAPDCFRWNSLKIHEIFIKPRRSQFYATRRVAVRNGKLHMQRNDVREWITCFLAAPRFSLPLSPCAIRFALAEHSDINCFRYSIMK